MGNTQGLFELASRRDPSSSFDSTDAERGDHSYRKRMSVTNSASNRSVVYIAHPASDRDTVSETVSARGLRLLKALPSQVNLVIDCGPFSRSYSTYVQNLSVAMKASSTNVRQEASFEYRYSVPSGRLDVKLPVLCLAFNAIDDVLKDKLRRLRFFPQRVYSKDVYICNTPDIDVMREFNRELRLNKVCNTPFNAVNYESMVSHLYVERIVYWFLKTHVYPRFTEIESTTQVVVTEEKEPAGPKRPRSETSSLSSASISSPRFPEVLYILITT